MVVRGLREQRGLSIEALADAGEMHPTYLSGIERGRFNPTWDKLCSLSDALDVPLSEIVRAVERRTA